MQNYNKNLNLLSEFLDFLKFKVDNKRMTLAEAENLKRIFFDNVSLSGTAEDIAKFYHKTPQDIRNVVHRKLFSKPERRVHYNFVEFMKVAPDKWRK